MSRTILHLLFLLLSVTVHAIEPTWEALDNRTLPAWYDEAKFGIFIHWGVFSVPSWGNEWFWHEWKEETYGPEFAQFVNATERPNFGYQDYAHRFTAELFDPDYWASIFAQAGAQYVVLTSKHHEGFCNWDSRNLHHTWNWNAMDIGPRRDLVGDLGKAVKAATSPQTHHKLKYGLYHSLIEWYNPLFKMDMDNNYTTNYFANHKTVPELYDLVKKYEPEIIWSDGDWNSTSDYWNVTPFLAWYATNSTVNATAVWNDRWGEDSRCKHGAFFTCADKYTPSNAQAFKYENCFTIDQSSWGYNRKSQIKDYETPKQLVDLLIETVAFNGNLLLNVGPRADGTLPPIFADRLVEMGKWLTVNGEAIYQTKPWSVCQNETALDLFYTVKNETLYAIFRKWPADDKLRLTCPVATDHTKARMLGVARSEFPVKVASNKTNERQQQQQHRKVNNYTSTNEATTTQLLERKLRALEKDDPEPGLELDIPHLNPGTVPCDHAWVVALTGIGNIHGNSTKTTRK